MISSSPSVSDITEITHLQLIVNDQKSTLLAKALGDAEAAARAEGLKFPHSNFQPTGRYAKKGTPLTITVSPPISGLEVVIGQYGVYANLNNGVETKPISNGLNAGANRIVAPIDGMVYIQNRRSSGDAFVDIEGGQPVPTFIKGVTTRTEFDLQILRWYQAPFIELIGEYIHANFQYAKAVANLIVQPTNLDRRIAMMDEVVAYTNAHYGLSRYALDFAHKSSHYMYIANPDVGVGFASAFHYRITFQVSTGAGTKILVGPENDQFGLYHEVGHTYQMDESTWSGLIEITNNVSSLTVQEAQGFPNYLDVDSVREDVAIFRKTPIAQRDFEDIGSNGRLKVLMFDQLRRGFGNNFYAHLSQQFRIENAKGIPEPVSDFAVRQHFMVTAANVTGRNLTPFFEEWGMQMDDATHSELAKFPDLKEKIWNNFDRKTDKLERNLPSLEVPCTLTGPAQGAIFSVGHMPIYRGIGTPGATITVEQGLRSGGWEEVGTATVDSSGEWYLFGADLTAGEREARATQTNGGYGLARNTFTVVDKMPRYPVTLTSPAGGASFDVNHEPVYRGRGTPGAAVTIEQGLLMGARHNVGTAYVNINGDWSLSGEKLTAGKREVRVAQQYGGDCFATNSFTVTERIEHPVTLTSPAEGAVIDPDHFPRYSGSGTPGATITVQQGQIIGGWYEVGTTTVDSSGGWSLIGQNLPAGEREARAIQESNGSISNYNPFTVKQVVKVPITLTTPAAEASFDESHVPVYSGTGTPNAIITVEQGLRTGNWFTVGATIVNPSGNWSLTGHQLAFGQREVRATQNYDSSDFVRRNFTVTREVVPVILTSPENSAVLDENSLPLYGGRGTPGALVIIEDGPKGGNWNSVGITWVDHFGDWFLTGHRLGVGEKAIQATQYIGGESSSDKVYFCVKDQGPLEFPTPPRNLRYEWTSATTGLLSWDSSTGDSNEGNMTYHISQRPSIWHPTQDTFYTFTWLLPTSFTARVYAIQSSPEGVKRSEEITVVVKR
ncbi:M60 family metallopeptidase [Pseudomonas sp. SIMBA_077]